MRAANFVHFIKGINEMNVCLLDNDVAMNIMVTDATSPKKHRTADRI